MDATTGPESVLEACGTRCATVSVPMTGGFLRVRSLRWLWKRDRGRVGYRGTLAGEGAGRAERVTSGRPVAMTAAHLQRPLPASGRSPGRADLPIDPSPTVRYGGCVDMHFHTGG